MHQVQQAINLVKDVPIILQEHPQKEAKRKNKRRIQEYATLYCIAIIFVLHLKLYNQNLSFLISKKFIYNSLTHIFLQ
jgi:hypothetical protein